MKKIFKSKGFTVVELLIVVVVISVLAAMLMMSSDETVSSARAAKIISDLTNIKNAVNQWYLNNLSKINRKDPYYTQDHDRYGKINVNGVLKAPQHLTGTGLGLYEYFTGPKILVNESGGAVKHYNSQNLNPGSYGFYDAGNTSTIWYVGYAFKDGEDKVKNKIAARAEPLGLFFTVSADPYDIVDSKPERTKYYTNKKIKDVKNATAVWMPALDMNAEKQ